MCPAPPRLASSEAEAVHDPVRLRAVAATGLLDSAARDSFDGLTNLAAQLLDAPMAFMTLVDGHRSFFLSSAGVDTSAGREIPVEGSFCQYVVADRAPFQVQDAGSHPRTRDNPSVEALGIGGWAGCPVTDGDGAVLGSFCVMDTVPREWSPRQLEILAVLARSASWQVALLGAVEAERTVREALDVVRGAERRAEDRLARLADVSLRLVGADSLADLTDIVVNQGLRVLGVDGGAVLVRDDEHQRMRLAVSASLGERVQETYASLPFDSPLPGCTTARTGQRLVLPDRAAGLAWSPAMAGVYADIDRGAWVHTPLRVGSRLLGALSVCWLEEREVSDDDLSVIDAFAAQCAQALARIQTAEAQREAHEQVRRLSEALQRSLLTQPATTPDLQIAVRYLPAVQVAQVGGDWYDAFATPTGATLVSVGDVAGHDGNAAAAMAQVRNLLRGLAVDGDDSPAVLLGRLDRAMHRLGLDTPATALLARVECGPHAGTCRVVWASAGHLPPLVRLPSGRVRVLTAQPDLLLGLDPSSPRRDHVTALDPGCLLLLYTDGLVERRGEDLDVGLGRLAAALAVGGGAAPEQVCDALLASMLSAAPTDDVALLVLKPAPPAVTPDAL